MTLTTHPTHPMGSGPVKVMITADTICQPHGPVSTGDVIEVSVDEFYVLKHSGKAVLYFEVKPEPEQSITADEFRAVLDKKTKAELIQLAKEEFSLELSDSKTKQELTDAIVEAALDKG